MEASFFGFFYERVEIVIENQASNPFYVGKEYQSEKKRERERTRKEERGIESFYALRRKE